jgi:hypothetical protein
VSTEVIPSTNREQTQALIERMADAGQAWLASLSPEQRAKATYEFPNDEERTLWYYTPSNRGGLPLVEQDPIQQRLAHRFIASGLSVPGYVTASTIMGIENVLDAIEGWRTAYPGRTPPSRGRDPLLYFVTVFGRPGDPSWGWRVGGHHISLQYAIVDGRLASPTPLFFGSNPAEAHHVGPGLLRPLAGEEDLGRELLKSLEPEQLSVALLHPVAPTDIVQANRPYVEEGAMPRGGRQIWAANIPDEEIRAFQSRDVSRRVAEAPPADDLSILSYTSQPKGLAGSRMSRSQREIFSSLVGQYIKRLPEEIADLYLARATGSALEALHFAWAGGQEHREKHYYRIQGPRLLIEYDCTQDNANHIHSVWRDPEGDWGADLLAQHYRDAH